MDHLIVLIHWFMAALFVGWGIYFVYCLVRFRSREGHQASVALPKATASKYSEIVVVVIEAVLLLGFSVPIWARVRGPSHAPPSSEALVVRVVGEQFAWNVHYPGVDGEFGVSHPGLMSAENPLGLDRSQPDAADDIVTINQFHVPVNKDILVHLTSKDVIHSFGLPLLRVKQDMIPGMSIPVWFRATRTTRDVREDLVRTYSTTEDTAILSTHVAMREYGAPDGIPLAAKGDLLTPAVLTALAEAGIDRIEAAPEVPTEIACAQLCGLGHYRMRGFLHVETQEEYDEWMSKEQQWLQGDEEGYDAY